MAGEYVDQKLNEKIDDRGPARSTSSPASRMLHYGTSSLLIYMPRDAVMQSLNVSTRRLQLLIHSHRTYLHLVALSPF
jgi:hypothetical protein